MSILDLVQQQLGPQQMEQIGQQLGTDAATTRQAVDAALPALVGGMASTAQQPGGESEIRTLAGSQGGAMGLGMGDLGAMIGGGGGGILGSILGRTQPDVEHGVEKASGLDSDRTRKLLMILAPIVLSALAKRTAGGAAEGAAGTGGGLGGILNGGLADVLRQDATQAQQKSGGGPLGGALGKILGGLGG